MTKTSYRQVVEVAAAVSLDGKHGEEQCDLVIGRCDDSDLTVDVPRVITRPAWTHNTTARRRKILIARYQHTLLLHSLLLMRRLHARTCIAYMCDINAIRVAIMFTRAHMYCVHVSKFKRV